MTSEVRPPLNSDDDNGEGDYVNENEWSDIDQGSQPVSKQKGKTKGRKLIQSSLSSYKHPVRKKRRLSSNDHNCCDLSEIQIELKNITEMMKSLVKKDEVQSLINSISEKVVKKVKMEIKNDLEKSLTKKMDENIKKEVKKEVKVVEQEGNKKIGKIVERCDGLDLDIHSIREKMSDQSKEIREMKNVLNIAMTTAKEALKTANHNQQYSQKNNIKLLNWREKRDENSESLTADFIAEMHKVGVDITENDILAIHRIPSKKQGAPKPVILKFLRSETRIKVIKKRKEVKSVFTLIDHVTEKNLDLMNSLRENDNIHSVWYFNCNIHAIDVIGHRHKFFVGDDNDRKLRSIQAAVTRAGNR
ncbi:hypothetical protein FSP39_003135 [Pinctada imbricata]|uniref:Uncharacterized protein n=1 Tax=Pinctada imbricata TaxID=66713 RepID=A0AA89C8M2_PINIB|nr:hypothetical protein FSP39_003135 [Pinctada imbricata]